MEHSGSKYAELFKNSFFRTKWPMLSTRTICIAIASSSFGGKELHITVLKCCSFSFSEQLENNSQKSDKGLNKITYFATVCAVERGRMFHSPPLCASRWAGWSGKQGEHLFTNKFTTFVQGLRSPSCTHKVLSRNREAESKIRHNRLCIARFLHSIAFCNLCSLLSLRFLVLVFL